MLMISRYFDDYEIYWITIICWMPSQLDKNDPRKCECYIWGSEVFHRNVQLTNLRPEIYARTDHHQIERHLEDIKLIFFKT